MVNTALSREAPEKASSRFSVTINRPSGELFAYWRDFQNLPQFIDNVERIDVIDEKRTHWVIKAPADKTVEWDALITEESQGHVIARQSAENADVSNRGRVPLAIRIRPMRGLL